MLTCPINTERKHAKKNIFNTYVPTLLATAFVLFFSQQAAAQNYSGEASAFRLCGSECGLSRYYVAGSRVNSATAKGITNAAPITADRIWRNVADLNAITPLPNADLRIAGTPNIEFASSRYEITANRIGFSQKSEEMTTKSISDLSETKAGTKLFWGDSFRVTSTTLSAGTPIRIEIKRSVGGAGQVSDFSFYSVSTETYFNKNKLVDLNYSIAKAPGGTDVIIGDAVETRTIQARVGEIFTIESLLSIVDGLEAKANSSEYLTGAFDSVGYEIRLDPNSAASSQACLRSFSGTYRSGDCR